MKVIKDTNTDYIVEYVDGKPIHLQNYKGIFWFHAETPESLKRILCQLYQNKTRVKFYYGDIKTNELWGDIETGRIGRSTGRNKIPLIIYNNRSMGGPSLLDHSIVKIELSTKPNTVLYQNSID